MAGAHSVGLVDIPVTARTQVRLIRCAVDDGNPQRANIAGGHAERGEARSWRAVGLEGEKRQAARVRGALPKMEMQPPTRRRAQMETVDRRDKG